MGSSLCRSDNSSVGNPKKTVKTPNPTQLKAFTSLSSRLVSRALNPDRNKRKKKLSIGKSLSFQRIPMNKLLNNQSFPDENLLESATITKKSLFYSQAIHTIENEDVIIQEFSTQYPLLKNFKILKNEISSILISCEEKNKEILIKRKIFDKIDAFSSFLVHLQNISKYQISGIEKFKELYLSEINNRYIIDIFKENHGNNLTEYLKSKGKGVKNYLEILEILKKVSIILHQLHRKNVAFKTLKPSTVLIEEKNQELSIKLAIGGSNNSQLEDVFVEFYVKNQEDYESYDVLCLGFMTLTLFSDVLTLNQLYTIRNNKDISDILEKKCPEIPKILLDFMKKLLDVESRHRFQHRLQLIAELESIILKGVQNQFKPDFLSEVFNNQLNCDKSHFNLFFHHKNKIFIYNESKKITYVLKVYLGGRKWKLRSSYIEYSNNLKGFITLGNNFDAKIVKIPFDENSVINNNNQKIIEIECKIEFLYEIKGNSMKFPELLTFNNNIYLISNKIYEISGEKSNFKEKILGNTDISSDLHHYSFIDSQGEYMYILKQSSNIFLNGMSIQVQNLKNSSSNIVKLKFQLNNPEMLKNFHELNISISHVYFSIELNKNIYLINISKVLLILDFSTNYFYSFSSLFQLENYEFNKKARPMSYPHTFEIRNVPFQLDFSQKNQKNISFEEGILKYLCRKDSEILLCKFILIPTQSCISLLNCLDLASGQDFMMFLPKEIKLDWSLIQKKEIFTDPPINKIGNYEILSILCEEDNDVEYKVRRNNELFCLKRKEIASLQEFEKLQKGFFFILENSYLLGIKELFLHKENDKLYVIFIREHFDLTLMQEFLYRKSKKKYYTAKNLAFLMKCIFKGVIFLIESGVKHGNIDFSNIVFTDKGFLKIKGWYLENRNNFVSDILDTGLLLLECATLDILYEFNEFKIENNKDFLEINYPGLYKFLLFLVKQDMNKIDIETLAKEIKKTYIRLEYKDFDISKYQTERQKMFWINYGDNSIITADVGSQNHQVYKIENEEKQAYVFSTFNSFVYDQNNDLYVTGHQKNLKIKTQEFFILSLSSSSNTTIPLKSMTPIPINILNPTLIYVEKVNSIYLFGGYVPSTDSHKKTSNQVLSYHLINKTWNFRSPMPLGLVSATAVLSKKGIYLFGGISQEIDLTGPELCFLQYELETEKWEFVVNFARISPFENSRLLQPNICSLGDEVFLFFQRKNEKHVLEIFELEMGGLNVKFENDKGDDEFNNERQLQNELSLCFNAGMLFNLEEKTKELFIWDIKNFEKSEIKKIKCSKMEAMDEEFKEFERKALNSD